MRPPKTRILGVLLLLSAACLLVVTAGGCAQLDKAALSADAWLTKPVADQPGAPSNADVIKVTAATAANAAAPGVGTAIGAGIGVVLLGLHDYASRRRKAATDDKLGEVVDGLNAVADVANATHEAVTNPPAPAAAG